MEHLQIEKKWRCPKCGHSPCTCWSKSSDIACLLGTCPRCGQEMVGSRCDTCSGSRENDICGGCGRTKKACQAANGSGCSRN